MSKSNESSFLFGNISFQFSIEDKHHPKAFPIPLFIFALNFVPIRLRVGDHPGTCHNYTTTRKPKQSSSFCFQWYHPTQKYFYRFSKSRGKADYFEGRDDSGVVSARFINVPGGTDEYRDFYNRHQEQEQQPISEEERLAYTRLYENCIAMGAPVRPNTDAGTLWSQWFGSEAHPYTKTQDRCRILFVINTVGMGRGTTMIWETNPPLLYGELPPPWTSEQETAITHLQRNLEEINSMCQTGYIAAKIQMLVCEPISAIWTEWIDGQVPACGGKAFDPNPPPPATGKDNEYSVEDRPSPIQIVVAANAETADTCHDLKSGFMEQRMQDLAIAPPYLSSSDKGNNNKNVDPTIKMTNPDLFSSDHHDVYVAMKWSTLVTIRSVHAFVQASADIAAGAGVVGTEKAKEISGPSSPFLIPSFVRVSYVSEENSKVAKWRMHGDFFHPAAWEICKDSFDMTFIPYSLSGSGGVRSICNRNAASSSSSSSGAVIDQEDCGQWWIYFTELQMPTSPEVFANEVTPPVVQGGSNFFWMITDRQRQEIVKGYVCHHNDAKEETAEQQREVSECPELPQAIIPLGDMESFLINFTPNTALGRHHIDDSRRPGYSNEEERTADRQRVKERKQLNDQEDIEKALFDYTIYPAALFHKDATLKAARSRDVVLTAQNESAKQYGEVENAAVGPQTIKSSYYDVTITKPRPPVLGWCQMIARRGLCTLYADYFRASSDNRCHEACGFKKDWTRV